MSARLVHISDELAALADACHEPARADEPYRRALRVVHGRLTATARRHPGPPARARARPGPAALRHARGVARPTSTPSTLRCAANGSALLADDRLARLREAVHVFGFHLSGLDLRQNSDVHEEVVAELLAWAGVHPDYASLPEPDRVELLAAELATRRPLIGEGAATVGAGPQGTRHRRSAAARAVHVFGPRRDPELHHLDVPVGVGHARGGAAAQGGGPAGRLRSERRTARSASSRCSRPSTTCSAARRSWKRCSTFRCTARWFTRAARARK